MSNGEFGGVSKDNCLQIAKDITIAAIQHGILSSNVKDIADFFSTVYFRVFSVGIESLDQLEKTFKKS